MVVQAGDERRGERDDRHARSTQFLDRREPPAGRRSARLQRFRQRAVERGERDADVRRAVLRQLAEVVEVARDEMVFRDDADRLAKLREHREAAPRELEPPLDGLVAVADRAHRDGHRLPVFFGKLAPEQLGRVFLHHDLRLEIEPRGEAEIFVVRPREAVGAAVLAAAVRIQPGAKRDVRRVVEGNDRLRVVAEKLRARAERRAVVIHERLGLQLDAEFLETVVRIRDRAAPGRRGILRLK